MVASVNDYPDSASGFFFDKNITNSLTLRKASTTTLSQNTKSFFPKTEGVALGYSQLYGGSIGDND
jgi:hypothetical protein